MPDQDSLSIAVVGLGSIGGIAAACLAGTGRHRLVACTRRPLPRLTFEHEGHVRELPLENLTEPAQAGPADWVLLATKAQDTGAAGAWLRRLCGPGTRVAVLQNGLGQRERVAPFVGEAGVLPVVVYYNGERLAPDRVRLRQVAELDLVVADDAEGRAFAALFEDGPLRIGLSDDMTTLLWRKLLLNLTANPVTALTRRRQGVTHRPDVQALCREVLAEAIAVGRAEGARFAVDEAERTLAALRAYPAEAGTSMYFDVLAGRPPEVEAMTGALVAAAERHGLAVPVNRTLLTLLRALDVTAPGAAPEATPGARPPA